MKIFLLHGDDETKSYERLMKFIKTAKSRSWEVVYLDESNLSLQESLSARSLFTGERFFLLKDIKMLEKKETEWLKKKIDKLEGNLVIYHEGVVPITLLKSLPEPVKVEEFKLPRLVFDFLESIRPKNENRAIELLHEVAKKDPPEFTFSLLSRHFRDLYWVKVESGSVPYQSWRVGKLKKQAANFTVTKLKELLSYIAKVDVEIKTSDAEIIPSLDLLIATKLE